MPTKKQNGFGFTIIYFQETFLSEPSLWGNFLIFSKAYAAFVELFSPVLLLLHQDQSLLCLSPEFTQDWKGSLKPCPKSKYKPEHNK